MPTKAFFPAVLLTVAFAAQAQQYRWVDERGRIQYTDTPPPASARSVQKKEFGTGPPDSGTEPFALQTARKNAPVKLYSTPDCGAGCDEARRLLNERGIPFTEITITDAAKLEELKSVSGATSVPVLLVGSSVQKGFEKGLYDRALEIAGYPAAGVLRPRNQKAPDPPKPPPAAAPAQSAPAAQPPTGPQAR